MAAPLLFKSTDTGAKVLTGQVGKLLDVLDSCLCLHSMFTGISGASFVDNTAEARLQGGTTFTLFQGPTATNDEAYFGLQVKSERLWLFFGTVGVQGSAVTLAWEYWNGAAWTALSGLSDGTNELTQNGQVTWTVPGDWATKSVNGVTLYWVRLTFTAGTWSTNPLVAYCTHTGWSQPFTPATNQCAYQPVAGNQMYLNVNDNGPGAGAAKEARCRSYETMSALDTGTGPFPTAAQLTAGAIARKSTTADATARAWVLLADDRVFYLFMLSGDAVPSGSYMNLSFGDLFSVQGAGDAYRTMIIGRPTENSGTAANEGFGRQVMASGVSPLGGHYTARNFAGAAGAVQSGKFGNAAWGSSTDPGYLISFMQVSSSDGSYLFAPLWWLDGATSTRGRLRGLWHSAVGTPTDGDTISGTGALSGKTLYLLKQIPNNGALASMIGLETSDTWETN